jgi:hypothetical protein
MTSPEVLFREFLFDTSRSGHQIADGIALTQGWYSDAAPFWSRDRTAVLTFETAYFANPHSVLLKLKTYNPDVFPLKKLTIHSEGHAPIETDVPRHGKQSILIQTPVIAPGAASGQVRISVDNPQSPSQLGLAPDDRLLGVHIVEVIENPIPMSFPIDLTSRESGAVILGDGWSIFEPGMGAWSFGSYAQIFLPRLPELAEGGMLEFEVETVARNAEHPALEVQVWHGDQGLASWDFSTIGNGLFRCPLPTSTGIADLEISFRIDKLLSPQMLGVNADTRLLGIRLKSIDCTGH